MSVRLVLLCLLLPAAILGATSPKTKVCNNIKNYMTTYLDNSQCGMLVDKMGTNGANCITLSESATDLQNFVVQKVITAKQTSDLVNLTAVMSKDLGGMDKTTALLNILASETLKQCGPYEIEILNKIKAMKKSGKSLAARKKQALTMLANMINPDVIGKSITAIKKRFTQDQCDVAFKYLPPKYFKLGLYSFKATPCTGIGHETACTPDVTVPKILQELAVNAIMKGTTEQLNSIQKAIKNYRSTSADEDYQTTIATFFGKIFAPFFSQVPEIQAVNKTSKDCQAQVIITLASALTPVTAKVSIIAGFKTLDPSLCGPLFEALNSINAIPFTIHSLSQNTVEALCSSSSTAEIGIIQQAFIENVNMMSPGSFNASVVKAFSNILSRSQILVDPNTNTTLIPAFEMGILNLAKLLENTTSSSAPESN
ncbi:hypothetical protein FO519_007267 [Halicephalobus sp. NKZ332]|nr:hypothetical protein FO519_007267 [Halicephalobus sp. NKZ332]